MPGLTFILPVYGVERELPRALRSIAAQGLADWEAILVDDGSPDGCGAICDGAAARDARFRVIHQPNAGTGMARNAGLAAARGEYIHFLDPDDYLEPDFAERLLAVARREDADIVMFGFFIERQGPDGTLGRRGQSGPPVTGSFGYAQFQAVFPRFVTSHYVWNRLYRRRLLEAGGCRFTAHTIGQDAVFNASVYAQTFGRLTAVDAPLIHYVERAGSSVGRFHEDRLRDNFYVTRALSRVVRRWGREEDAAYAGALAYCAVRDLHLGIRNASLSPMGLAARWRWLRGLMADERLRRAVRMTPVRRMHGRGDRVKLALLKAHAYGAVMLLSGANRRVKGG